MAQEQGEYKIVKVTRNMRCRGEVVLVAGVGKISKKSGAFKER